MVVSIIYKGDHATEMAKLDKINGILYAGGEDNMDYWIWARGIYDYVKQQNIEGNFYPQWGTCLGFQMLMMYESINGLASRGDYVNTHYPEPLTFTMKPEDSAVFGGLTETQIAALQKESISYLSHHNGYDPALFETDIGIKNFFNLVATQKAEDGLEFATAIEGKDFPFYGIQFHAEKEFLSFAPEYHFNHAEDSEAINRHYADFFVG
jgi:gamma-glutamyl hydrolase